MSNRCGWQLCAGGRADDVEFEGEGYMDLKRIYFWGSSDIPLELLVYKCGSHLNPKRRAFLGELGELAESSESILQPSQLAFFSQEVYNVDGTAMYCPSFLGGGHLIEDEQIEKDQPFPRIPSTID